MRLAVLLVAALSVLAVSAQSQVRGLGTAAINQCYSALRQPPGTFDEVLKTRKIPSTLEEACFLGCVDGKLGLIRNGGIDVNKAKQVANFLYGHLPAKLKQAIDTIELCGRIVRDIADECSLGFAARKCLVTNSDPSFAPVESEIVRVLP